MRYYDINGKKNPNYRHGLKTSNGNCGLYNSWQNMKQRCTNPKNPKYHRYGARGITLCPEWMTIDGFSHWALNNGWQAGLTIDRIDNDGPYSPHNCRWISQSSNSRKKSTTKLNLHDAALIRQRLNMGERTIDLAREYGVNIGTIWFIEHNFTHVSDGQCANKIKERSKH
jgi:hypothetical protein